MITVSNKEQPSDSGCQLLRWMIQLWFLLRLKVSGTPSYKVCTVGSLLISSFCCRLLTSDVSQKPSSRLPLLPAMFVPTFTASVSLLVNGGTHVSNLPKVAALLYEHI